MKCKYFKDEKLGQRGLTLIELTLVISLLVMLSAVTFMSLSGVQKWKKAKLAGEHLRVVYLAQKTYLADHPTDSVSSLDAAKLIPYLATGAAAIPTIEKLDGSETTVKLDQMPPIVIGPYDPSARTDDGLWDVGKP